MPDLGHSLEFGTFITPTNAPAQQPVELARLSEELGFDLATFQDHPYQPRFLDTWTLLTWVAASTSRIRVSGNVLNLPLRQPAVLARSAASLDLLSGGRFELGLGAGGFWDAIEAMGGGRLTMGQAVTALGEAIDVIRGIWAADDRTPLRAGGEFHFVDGAKRGPAAAHDIPIWLGAYKPRMLRLVGTKADGWLPSLAYFDEGAIATSSRMVDDAATAAGRHPGEIRRLLNIGGRFSPRRGGMLDGAPEQWVEQLLPLAVENGFSTFILAADDPSTMQRFAEEVIPALRDAVSAERAERGTSTAPTRSAVALSARRSGIDYDAIPESLKSAAIEPGDFGFSRVRSTYLRGGNPGLVLPVLNDTQVADALAFSRTQDVPLAIRSGGHGISGRSTNDGGIVIDLGAIDHVEVLDEGARLVRIGAGARWMDVANALAPRGWALSSGDYGGVGVGGLATAGGIGWLVREHGLTIDHVRAVDMVLADGTAVRASAELNPDLFWAVRGAGANFGIVTSFEFEVDEVGEVGWAQLAFDATDTADFLEQWGAWIEGSPRDVTSFLIMGAPRAGRPAVAQVMVMVDSNDPDVVIERLQPLASVAPLVDQQVQLTSYAAVMSNAQDRHHDGQGEPNSRSALVEHLTPEFAASAAELLQSGAVYFFAVRSVGGAVADVPADATAYGWRSANFSVAAFGSDAQRIDRAWDGMREYFSGLYLSFETDRRPERIDDAFPPATLARLRALKATYDPDNVFRDNFSVAPSPAEG